MKWQCLPARNAGIKRVRTACEPAGKTWRALLTIAVMTILTASLVLLTAVAPLPVRAQTAQAANKDTLVNDIVNLDQQASDLNSKLASLSSQSGSLEGRISAIQGEVQTKQQKLADKKSALAARARSMYVNGRVGTLELLLSTSSIAQYLQRQDDLHKVTAQDTRLIQEVRQQSRDLAGSLSQLKSKKAEVDKVAGELNAKKDALAKTKSDKQALLAKAGPQSAAVEQQTRTVEGKMQTINDSTPPAPTGKRTGRFMTMTATAYSPQEPGLDDHTASGMKATKGVVAVDPSVIPLGTRLYVEGYGNAIAGDTGSAIKGNRIDLCFDTLEECNAYGWRTVVVEFLE